MKTGNGYNYFDRIYNNSYQSFVSNIHTTIYERLSKVTTLRHLPKDFWLLHYSQKW